MTQGQITAVKITVSGIAAWLLWREYNKPRLTYRWLGNGQLQFSLSKGSSNVSGVAELNMNGGITDNVQWIGDYAYSVISQSGSIMFQINDANSNIIFTQTVNSPV